MGMGNNPVSLVDPDGGKEDWYMNLETGNVEWLFTSDQVDGYAWLGDGSMSFGDAVSFASDWSSSTNFLPEITLSESAFIGPPNLFQNGGGMINSLSNLKQNTSSNLKNISKLISNNLKIKENIESIHIMNKVTKDLKLQDPGFGDPKLGLYFGSSIEKLRRSNRIDKLGSIMDKNNKIIDSLKNVNKNNEKSSFHILNDK